MSSLFNLPWQQAFDSSGNTVAGAKLYFYTAGTSTPQNVYSDIGLGVALPNPVIANSAGRFPPIYMADVAYKVGLYNADDELIWTADNVYAQSIDADAAFATAAVKATSVSAGYTDEQAEDSSNFPKAIFKYANASYWYSETGSVDNTYVLTGVDSYSRPSDYFAGFNVWFVSSRANTGASTVNVAGLGAKNIFKSSGAALRAGDIVGLVHLIYNGTSFIMAESDGSKYPVGSIYETVDNTNPSTIVGFGTWSLITSKVVIPSGKIPVYGDGKTLGLTNGTKVCGLGIWTNGTTQPSLQGNEGHYNKSLPYTATMTSVYGNGDGVGVVKSGESGIEVNMASATSVTIYIWKRTA